MTMMDYDQEQRHVPVAVAAEVFARRVLAAYRRNRVFPPDDESYIRPDRS